MEPHGKRGMPEQKFSGKLADRESLLVAEIEQLLHRLVELSDAVPEGDQRVAGVLLGIALVDGMIDQCFKFRRTTDRCRLVFAYMISKEIDRNAPDPRSESIFALKGIQFPEGNDERLLRKVFGLVFIEEPCGQAGAHVPLVAFHEFRERVEIACLCFDNQILVFHPGGARLELSRVLEMTPEL